MLKHWSADKALGNAHGEVSPVGKHALFFSKEDYSALQGLLRAADFYLDGKLQLSQIRAGGALSGRISDLSDKSRDMKRIRDQIQQNKRWLTRYRNELNDIRDHLHTGLADRSA